MIRLNLTAEGKTEQQFAGDLLSRHLADFSVYLEKPRLASLGKKKGRVHRGGMDRYLAVKNDIQRWMKQDKDTHVHDTPEKIDDGQHTAPSKRIINEIPEYKHAKATAGPIIANEIGLPTMRRKCPHFNEWLAKLEQLNSA